MQETFNIGLSLISEFACGCIFGGGIVHLLMDKHYTKRADEFLTDSFAARSRITQTIISFHKQLAKFHTQRDSKGRFVSKNSGIPPK